MNNDIDRRIKRKIIFISRGRRGDREGIQEYVLAAAEDLAGDAPVTAEHVDQAFKALGTPEEIRQSFFPKEARVVPAWAIIAYVASTLLAALDAFSSKSALCGGDGGAVRCMVTVGDGLVVSLLSVMPPLVVLASHFVGPRWLPTSLALIWVAGIVVPALVEVGLSKNVGILAAGIVTTTAAAIVLRRGTSA